jgi:cell division protein FtsL
MLRAVAFILGLSCFGSALAVVYASHASRKLFIELQALQEIRDELDVEWGRMQLEQSTWATHGRIEAAARGTLAMRLPAPENVVVVRP